MVRLVFLCSILLFFILASCEEDCGEQLWFVDADGDRYGDPADTLILVGCDRPEGYVLDNTDCDDTNENVHPDADEVQGDGIDRDCKFEIWDGEMIEFTKNSNADWTQGSNQDSITARIIFTRQTKKQLYNIQYWLDEFAQDISGSDLKAEFWDEITSLDFVPGGGTRGVRWTILDDTGADNPWDANFNLYGALGDPTNFYSFHNIASMIRSLNEGDNVVSVQDDFIITIEGGNTRSGTAMAQLVGKKLGAWIVDENIYLSFTFTDWGEKNGGSISYLRSTPPEQ